MGDNFAPLKLDIGESSTGGDKIPNFTIPTIDLDTAAESLGINASEPDKKKRGRKSKEEKERLSLEDDETNDKLAREFIETIKPALNVGLNIGLNRLPNGSDITQMELDMFCTTLIPVAKKYAPNIQKVQPEFIALAALGMIILPRAIGVKNVQTSHAQK